MKKRKIHRPGVPKLTAQNEQGEDEGIGGNAPVPFVFPPKRTKACENPCNMGLFARFSLFRDKEKQAAAGRRKNKLTRRGRAGCRFASFRMLFEIFHWN